MTDMGVMVDHEEELINLADWEEKSTPRRAFFVVGAEGSGSYMLAEALVAAGCHYQEEVEDFSEMPSPFVFRRSLPHAGIWPMAIKKCERIGIAGFDLHVLFILRDFNATIQSVLRRDGNRLSKEVRKNCISGLEYFGDIIAQTSLGVDDFTYITYESFIHSEGFRRWLFEERLQLPYPEDYEVYDGNLKYYE